MKRGIGLVSAGLVLGLLLGVFLYPALARKAPGGPVTLTARGSEVLDCWPVARSWSWAVNPVATKSRVAVCVRTTESVVPEGHSPAFPTNPKLPPKGTGAEKNSGWAVGLNKPQEGKVVCQFIDFREAGLGEATGRRPLRLLVRLRVSGGMSGISGAESVLEGETFAAVTEVESRWEGDELHLLTVYTQAGNKLYAHHLLVKQSDVEP